MYRRRPQASATLADRILSGEPGDQFHDLAEPSKKQIPEKDTTVKVYSYAAKISYRWTELWSDTK
jgi:hypothetical protein